MKPAQILTEEQLDAKCDDCVCTDLYDRTRDDDMVVAVFLKLDLTDMGDGNAVNGAECIGAAVYGPTGGDYWPAAEILTEDEAIERFGEGIRNTVQAFVDRYR